MLGKGTKVTKSSTKDLGEMGKVDSCNIIMENSLPNNENTDLLNNKFKAEIDRVRSVAFANIAMFYCLLFLLIVNSIFSSCKTPSK